MAKCVGTSNLDVVHYISFTLKYLESGEFQEWTAVTVVAWSSIPFGGQIGPWPSVKVITPFARRSTALFIIFTEEVNQYEFFCQGTFSIRWCVRIKVNRTINFPFSLKVRESSQIQ